MPLIDASPPIISGRWQLAIKSNCNEIRCYDVSLHQKANFVTLAIYYQDLELVLQAAWQPILSADPDVVGWQLLFVPQHGLDITHGQIIAYHQRQAVKLFFYGDNSYAFACKTSDATN